MTEITQPTPEQIRQIIQKHGITRSEAAAMVHVSINAWHKWSASEGSVSLKEVVERGERPHSSLLRARIQFHPTQVVSQ